MEPLESRHDRAAFSCGAPSIDQFLKQTAMQRQARRIASTIVAVDPDGDPDRIVGFFSLIPHEFRGDELPTPFRKVTRVGSLRAVPGALLAQLGVSREYQGRGIGNVLVSEALRRAIALAEGYGCAAIVTDPIDERAAQLYAGFDFRPLGDGTTRLIVAMKTVLAAFDEE
jgi:GNAT superfamily N-acetyltransferase